jgi:hypothetical protein
VPYAAKTSLSKPAKQSSCSLTTPKSLPVCSRSWSSCSPSIGTDWTHSNFARPACVVYVIRATGNSRPKPVIRNLLTYHLFAFVLEMDICEEPPRNRDTIPSRNRLSHNATPLDWQEQARRVRSPELCRRPLERERNPTVHRVSALSALGRVAPQNGYVDTKLRASLNSVHCAAIKFPVVERSRICCCASPLVSPAPNSGKSPCAPGG